MLGQPELSRDHPVLPPFLAGAGGFLCDLENLGMALARQTSAGKCYLVEWLAIDLADESSIRAALHLAADVPMNLIRGLVVHVSSHPVYGIFRAKSCFFVAEGLNL